MSVESFKNIFEGLDRARGVTYVDKKGEDGQKIKGKFGLLIKFKNHLLDHIKLIIMI